MRGSFRRVDKDWYFVPRHLLSQFDDVTSDIGCLRNTSEELANKYHISALDTFVEKFSKYRIDKLEFDLHTRSEL